MRSLVIFGITIAFIACAFVPPSEANFRALAARAKVTIERRKASFLGAKVPTIRKAAELVRTIAKNPQTTVLVEDAVNTAKKRDYTSLLVSAAGLLKGILPASQDVASTVADRLRESAGTQAASRWTELLSAEGNPVLRAQLERIDWAVGKGEARLCRELTNEGRSVKDGPSRGDLLALCLARVLRESGRCEQMSDASAAFRTACLEELATGSEPLSGLKLF